MGNALQDQLLKAGLVDKKKTDKVQKAKRKKQKMARKGQAAEVNEAVLNAQREKARQIERDRELNRQRQEAARQKALTAQIRQLIEMNRLQEWHGDIAYSFTDGTRIKRIHVSEKIQQQLSNGRLAIARLDDHYEPIASRVAEKIAARDPGCVIINDEPVPVSDDDDPYAEFKVPDDLMW